MVRKIVFGIVSILLILTMLAWAIGIQPVNADVTITIMADGSIDPPTAPIQRNGDIYTFTSDIFIDSWSDGIIVQKDNIVIDGAGYTIKGGGQGVIYGIDLSNRRNVTLENVQVKGFWDGVNLNCSVSNTIVGNIASENAGDGVLLRNSSGNTLVGNKATNNYGGFFIYGSDNNTLLSNLAAANSNEGILLRVSYDNTLRANNMTGNGQNFGVDGVLLSHFVNDVDVSNLVDGKSVYYLVNQNDSVFNPSTLPNVGCLILVNSTHVTVENLTLTTPNYNGLLLAYTEDGFIVNNTVTDAFAGIELVSSSWNVLSGNTMTNNVYGIIVYTSSTCNQLIKNRAISNSYGIALIEVNVVRFDNNTLTENVVDKNKYVGFDLSYSSNNRLTCNSVSSNGRSGISLDNSFNNTVYHNNFMDTNPVYLSGSLNTSWDDGYPSGGNYWSDYKGADAYCGPGQNKTGSDGIGDTPYVIDSSNVDHYPFVNPLVIPTALVGDLNGDGKVSLADLILLASAYNSKPGDPNWDSMADLAPPYGIISLTDLVTLAMHYGQHSP